jgi:hypothetical protein
MIKAGLHLLAPDEIAEVILPETGLARVEIVTKSGARHVAEGNDAIETVMLLKPSALEGRRLNWPKHAWAVHNLIGHPVMQVLAWLRFYRAAIRFHDWTTPAPR